MKKLSFLLGTLGGALAGYVFSNGKLRTDLRKAEDATDAAKILGKYIAKDGEHVAKEVGELAEQYELDARVADGKKYVQKYYDSAKKEVQRFLGAKAEEAMKSVSKAKKEAVKKVRSLAK